MKAFTFEAHPTLVGLARCGQVERADGDGGVGQVFHRFEGSASSEDGGAVHSPSFSPIGGE
jgi:hypothetical protein